MVKNKLPDRQTFAGMCPGDGRLYRGSLCAETRGRVGVKCGTEAGNGTETGGSGERCDENCPELGPAVS